MNQGIQRIEAGEYRREELHPLVIHIARSNLFRAITASITLSVVILFGSFAMDISPKDAIHPVAWSWVIVFLLATAPNLWRLIESNLRELIAIAEARAELITGVDLNNSGAVGDIKTVREIHLVNAPQMKSDSIPVETGDEQIDVVVDDLRMVVFDGDLRRGHWLGENDGQPREPFLGKPDPRGYFDAMMRVLEEHNQVNRTRGNARVLVAPPAAVWAALGFPV